MNSVSEFEDRRAELISEINGAFDGVPRDDGITLHQAIVLDDYGSPQEEQAARRLDQESRWQDVPDDDISNCCSALSFLDWKGFHYYIAVFMLYGLKHWEDDPNGILHSCEYHLLHVYPKSLRKSEPSLIADKYHFTKPQCEAIANFLRFIIDFDEMSAAEVTVQAVEKWERFVDVTS